METWTTTNLSERDQFSYWREVLCEAYIALNPTRPASSGGFVGNVKAKPISSINVTSIASERQKIYRGRREISRMPLEVYFLNLQVRGQCCMQQGGRAALLNPGEFALVDSTEPYLNDYCSDDWEQHSFRIPRHLLRPLLKNPDQATATRIGGNGGIETVTIEYLTSIAKNVEGLSSSGTTLTSSMVELVALAVGGNTMAREQGRGAARQALFSSLIKYIDLNIADSELSPAAVAAHFGISPRYLHKVLEEGGRSFGRLVLEGRLDRCAKGLAADSTPITEVALRWGFNDLSHFSRTFRQRFGKTPRDFRNEGTQVVFPQPEPGSHSEAAE
jgi:AraC family transcriptional activator of tynA and feaB